MKSMGVIHGLSSLQRADHAGGGGRCRTLDRRRAVRFVRTQSWWLERGLTRAEDATAVGIVLGTHDASHEAWLALIAALEADGDTGAGAVAALYEFHGRVVGFLERGLDQRLDPGVRSGLRSLLKTRLAQLTAAAAEGLEGAGRPGPGTAAPA